MNLWSDIAWAVRMVRARRMRRKLLFASRGRFDDALRPVLSDGARIAYPDAVYHVEKDDLNRAVNALSERMKDERHGR